MDEAIRQRLINTARDQFAGLAQTKNPGDVIESLGENLRVAGVSLAALDPTGKKSAADMQHEVWERHDQAIAIPAKRPPVANAKPSGKEPG